MLTREALFEHFHGWTRAEAPPNCEDDLIGIFQGLRPSGDQVEALLSCSPLHSELASRLKKIYTIAGDPARPQGGFDAYFVVRKPRPTSPEEVSQLSRQWLESLAKVAAKHGMEFLENWLDSGGQLRVLEGIAPKPPKLEEDQSPLFKAMESIGKDFTSTLPPACEATAELRQAYYFIACDPYLRDYLMWPLYSHHFDLDEPLESYLALWHRGIKFRIFGNSTIDFYMPRQ